MKDNVGVLMPVASLPGNHGIGDFGSSCTNFIKWLKKENYKYWQVLPLNPLGPGHSPYMSTCSKAIDERYICLDDLVKEGLLPISTPKYMAKSTSIKYEKVLAFKRKWLYIAYQNYMMGDTKEMKKWIKQNEWVIHFATYLAFWGHNDYSKWNTWKNSEIHYFENHKNPPKKYQNEIYFTIFMQFIALKQWNKVRKIAKRNGISLIADCPFYVGYDSVDCYMNKEQFRFDDKYNPTVVSGVPPDAFSDVGQLWGTPVYDFGKMYNRGFDFLIDRIYSIASMCDILRLDHFRAFDTYCVIPSGDENALRGVWEVGPRNAFFDKLYEKHPDIKLIAEDLGELFPSVGELRDHYALPGMFIVEFSLTDWKAYSHANSIVYTGTHDNQTLVSWFNELTDADKAIISQRLNYPNDLFKAIVHFAWNTPSKMTIFPLNDLLGLDDKARINVPGTTDDRNWTWKVKDSSFTKRVKYHNV